MSDSTQVTNPGAFQQRSLGKQVLFAILTLSLYMVYWMFITNKQLADGTDSEFNPVVRFVLLLIPIVNFIFFWKMCHDCEAVTDQGGVILFILGLVFPPAMWYLVQSGINDVASTA